MNAFRFDILSSNMFFNIIESKNLSFNKHKASQNLNERQLNPPSSFRNSVTSTSIVG